MSLLNPEKDIVADILRAHGLSASKLGLRFDRVVVRVMADLRAFVEAAAPAGVTVLVTMTAPIRLPARTVDDLKREIRRMFSAPGAGADHSSDMNGNQVRVRLLGQSHAGAPRLIGFVHNRDSSAEALLDLAEQWLRSLG